MGEMGFPQAFRALNGSGRAILNGVGPYPLEERVPTDERENQMNQKTKAIAAARKQIKDYSLTWENGKGYDLDYATIMEATGLGYGPCWRAIMAELMPKSERRSCEKNGTPMSDELLGAKIAEERYARNYSWGYIATQFGIGAGRVYRLFELATGIKAQGLRIGSGGRFYQGRSDLYTGKDRAEKGSEIKSGSDAKPTQRRVLGQKVAAAKKAATK